jgi:hypothetical protein
LGDIVALVGEAATRLVPLPIGASAALIGVLEPRFTSPDSSGADPTRHKADREHRAADAFNGRFGEGKHPAWRALLGEPSLAALRRVGPPGLDELSAWFWQPIAAALQPPATMGGRP